MSRSCLPGGELQSEIDDPLHLLRREPAGEGGHRAVAVADALPHGGAVPPPHHGGGEQVEIRIELHRLLRPLPAVTVAARALVLVERGRAAVARARAAGEERQRQGGEEEPPHRGELPSSRRCTWVAVAWSRGRTTISSMLTCDGRVAAKTMQSATSAATRGCMPR